MAKIVTKEALFDQVPKGVNEGRLVTWAGNCSVTMSDNFMGIKLIAPECDAIDASLALSLDLLPIRHPLLDSLHELEESDIVLSVPILLIDDFLWKRDTSTIKPR